MYIAIYVCVIVVVCVCAIGLFVFFNKRDKTRKQNFVEQRIKEDIQKMPQSNIKDLMEQTKEEASQEVQLEEFSLDEIDAPSAKEENDKSNENFVDYEEFLKRSANLEDGIDDVDDYEDDDEFTESDDAIDQLLKFDFDKIKGKSRSEVVEAIKDLPQNLQEIILEDFDKDED